MLSFFQSVSPINSGRVHLPSIDYFRRTYQREHNRVQSYYMNGVRAVRLPHFLNSLLIQSTIPSKYDLHRYAELASIRTPETIRQFKLTSELVFGEVRPSAFYGPEMDEIVVGYDEYFDVEDTYSGWKTVSAVKVLEHPISDLGMYPADGRSQTQEDGLVVIGINVPELLVQYRGFRYEQHVNWIQEEIEPLSTSHFVYMYVLPNMLGSHLDIALLNRAMKLFRSEPLGVSFRRHPFSVTDYSSTIDRNLVKFLDEIHNRPKLYDWYLKNLPSLIASSQEINLQIPGLTPTRQVQWALIASRLRVIEFLVDLGGDRGLAANGTYIGQLKTDLKRLTRDRGLVTRLGRDLGYDVLSIIDKLRSL